MLTQIFYHAFAGDGTLQTSLAAGRVRAQGLDRHRQSLHNVQALSRSSSPNGRSGWQMGHPSPWQSLMLPPGAAAGSADLLVPLDTAPSPSALA